MRALVITGSITGILLIILTIFTLLPFVLPQSTSVQEKRSDVGPYGSAHRHANFSLVINDNPIDFSQQKYQLQSRLVHFEHGNGQILHVHADDVTVGFALATLGIHLTDTCLIMDASTRYCENGKAIVATVNGENAAPIRHYEIRDGDDIRIAYTYDYAVSVRSR